MASLNLRLKSLGLAFGLAMQQSLVWAEDMVAVAAAPISTTKKIIDWIVEAVVKYSFQVLGGLIILAIGWICANFAAKFVREFLQRKKIDITISKFIVGSVKLAVMAFAIIMALGKFGIEIAPFIAGLSVVGFATSFALQGPLSNYAAGASLIFTKPFRVGEIIEVAGVAGEVEDITLPRTVLKTLEGVRIVVPNKHIIGEIIHNYSDIKKVVLKIGVGYKTDIDLAIELIRKAIKDDPRALTTDPRVGIYEFGDSAVLLSAAYSCKQTDYWPSIHDINKKIFDAYKANNIDMPFPQRDVHIYAHEGLK